MIQSIVASCNLSLESDTFKTIIEDIKTKIKSSTKNNALIHDELDYLFDQRCTNLETVYEKVSLVDYDQAKYDQFKSDHSLNEEFIDLTNNLSTNKLKKPNNTKIRNTNKVDKSISNKMTNSNNNNKCDKFVISLKKHND